MEKSFSRSLESLESLYEFTEDVLIEGGVADPVKNPIHLAMEELFVNMVEYNPLTTTDIKLEIDTEDGLVTVTLTEYGVDPFDVTHPRIVDIDAPLEERTPGGLGLHLIQNMVDNLEYEYEGGRSRVKFTKMSGTEDV
jgi:anti-sigma regulatory factor (Ser/Thr protein kinase)